MNIFVITALIADLSFSAADPGCVPDKANPEMTPGFARTENIYGRRLGDALAVNPRLEYPRYAIGRDGKVSAVRTGNALHEVPGSAPDAVLLPDSCALPTNGPSTQLMWFYIYEQPDLACSVRIIESHFGWQEGFRLDYCRAHWCRNGTISFTYGDGKGSRGIGSHTRKDILPGVWHQLAIVNDGNEFTLYLDGDSLGTSPGNYVLRKGQLKVKMANVADRTCFKTDCYRLYDIALTAEEVAEDWKNGQPEEGWNSDESAAVAALPVIDKSRQGFYNVGETIEVKVGDKVVKSVSFDKTGIQDFEYEGRHFPLCIIPVITNSVTVGAVDLMNRQPELLALGIRKTLLRASWWSIEPEKNAYDWTGLDRAVDACVANGVTPVLLLCDEPRWYSENREVNQKQFEKIKAVLQARYELPLADGKDIGYVDMNNAATVAAQIEKHIKDGKKHIFVRQHAPGWKGLYSVAFEGRPVASVLALAEYLAGY